MAKQKNKKPADNVLDRVAGFISPRWGFDRKRYRAASDFVDKFGYNAIDKSRTRRKRTGLGGTGDTQLNERALYDLREICREQCRNNPIVKGLLKTERDGLIGSGVRMEARTSDKGWNDEAENLWKMEMIDQPCDVTGRFNFNNYLRMLYLAYRRDGDAGTIFIDDDTLQGIEGDQIGTPYAKISPNNYTVVNGVAISKQTKRVIGYYVGQPSKWGNIQANSFQKYKADQMHMMFDPERFTQSRGEPILTSAIDYIDKLDKYVDAELVAACVNACYTMFISRKDSVDGPEAYTGGISETGQTGEDEGEQKLEKMGEGSVFYGQVGETAIGIGQTRPGTMFQPFVNELLIWIGRPLLMPLMLVTGDFAGATFMNARIAYQKVQESWIAEQDCRVKPFCGLVWRRKIDSWIRRKLLKPREDQYAHETVCKRWPYVDPFKEAKAQQTDLENGTTNRKKIVTGRGEDYEPMDKQLTKENKKRAKLAPALPPAPGKEPGPEPDKKKKKEEDAA